MENRRLEGTGITLWGEEHTEHMARMAAETGDTSTEQTCDEVLAGLTDACVLISIVEVDGDYHDWMAHGSNLGLMSRAG